MILIREAIFFIIVGLSIGSVFPSLGYGESRVYGTVYPIEEKDALEEIQSRVRQKDWQSLFNKPHDEWAAFSREVLPVTQEAKIRRHKLVHYLEQEIPDHEGKVIYPKGFGFYPLAYIRLRGRMVIGGKEFLAKFVEKGLLLLTDTLLLAGEGDPVELSGNFKHPVYLLNSRLRENLGLDVSPVFVTQDGEYFVLDERLPTCLDD